MVAPVQKSGRIDPAALPTGRFLYQITGQSPAVSHEGQVLEKIQVGDDWFLKLKPGHEWARHTHVFVLAHLPDATDGVDPGNLPVAVAAMVDKRSLGTRRK